MKNKKSIKMLFLSENSSSQPIDFKGFRGDGFF